MSKHPKPWSHRRWAVVLTSHDPRDPPILIGTGWNWNPLERRVPRTEPPRALLFNTREQARAWCRDKMDTWARGEFTRRWRVRPVAVRETVELIEPRDKATAAKGPSNG